MFDEIDLNILNIVQSNAKMTNAEIARQIGLAPSAALERVRKLEERGLIRDYAARLDAKALGFGMTAFVFVRTDDMSEDSADDFAAIEGVQEVHNVAGEDCYLLKVRVADAEALGNLLTQKIAKDKNVRSTRSIIVLKTTKEEISLPIAGMLKNKD